MVTSPYEWKILEWDEKPLTYKKKFAKIILLIFNDYSAILFYKLNDVDNSKLSQLLDFFCLIITDVL